jgi:polyvinyl alcohol dehydrogenase (cytochrome)
MFKLTRVLRIRRSKLLGAAAFAAAFGMASSPVGAAGAPAQPDWTSSGQNNFNTRHAALEHTIGADNVGGLKPKWIFTTAGNVSATATVVHGVAYVPDWGGMLWAIDTKTGKAIWSHTIGDYTGTKVSGSRTSPAYANGVLVIGTGNLMTAEVSPAFEIAINAETGEMLWRTQMDDDTAAIMTGSPTIDDGVVYTGVSSKTEHMDIAPAFRGSIEALDLKTGKILWKKASTAPPCGAANLSSTTRPACCTSPPVTATPSRPVTASIRVTSTALLCHRTPMSTASSPSA